MSISTSYDSAEYWQQTVRPLVMQGDFQALKHLEESNMTWKSIIHGLSVADANRLVTGGIDTVLNAHVDICGKGRSLTEKCRFCPKTATLSHILSNCDGLLYRYGWRHDNVLRVLYNKVKEGTGQGKEGTSPMKEGSGQVKEGTGQIKEATSQPATDERRQFEVFADMEGCRTDTGVTIPTEIYNTTLRPDLVVLWRDLKQIMLVELTVPFETNFEASHQRKLDRYAQLIHGLESSGFVVIFVAIEIGCRGLVTGENTSRLIRVLSRCRVKAGDILNVLSHCALVSSFVVFQSRYETVLDGLLPLCL